MTEPQRPVSRTVWVIWDNGGDRPLRGAKTHTHSCFVVDPKRPGPRHEFRAVAIADLPEDVGRCEICGGGRPPDRSLARQSPGLSRQAEVASRTPLPDDVIAPGRSFTVRDNLSSS